MHIAIPSARRAGKLASLRVIPSATVYVPEGEYGDYMRATVWNGGQLKAVPQGVRGITATRNWILDNCGDRHVVMIDDDVKIQGWIQLFQTNGIHRKLNEAEWRAVWRRLFETTEQLGFAVWGVATDGALRSVYPWRPFIFHTYVTASCMGIVNDGRTRFDEAYPVKEDYELCLRCIERDGGILGARFCYWTNEHWEGEGGCKTYRTQAMEDEVIKRLIARYGKYIRRVTRGGSRYSVELDF